MRFWRKVKASGLVGFLPAYAAAIIAVTLVGKTAFAIPAGTTNTQSPLTTTNTNGSSTNRVAEKPPASPREFFNAGTRQMQAGKLQEAEALLQTTLASQVATLQPPALYNLGHIRYAQGIESLKKGPDGKGATGAGRSAIQGGEEAIRVADQALAGDDIDKLVEAYIRGRGQRKEMKAAANAVQQALESHRAALTKWRRSLGDFKSTVEMNESDKDARHNVEVVEKSIARLVDMLNQMQPTASMLGDKKQELGEKLKQLKGRIPAPNMPPGAAGDDEEDEDSPMGKQPGEKEAASKEGKEMNLTPEQAGWLLEGFKLDSERRLPMGQGEQGKPMDRNRPTW